jgi:hypothetical protein
VLGACPGGLAGKCAGTTAVFDDTCGNLILMAA